MGTILYFVISFLIASIAVRISKDEELFWVFFLAWPIVLPILLLYWLYEKIADI